MQSIISVGIARLCPKDCLAGRVLYSLPCRLGQCFSNLNSILSLIILINLFLFNVFRCWGALFLLSLWLDGFLSGSGLLSSLIDLVVLWSNFLSCSSGLVVICRSCHWLCVSLHALGLFRCSFFSFTVYDSFSFVVWCLHFVWLLSLWLVLTFLGVIVILWLWWLEFLKRPQSQIVSALQV